MRIFRGFDNLPRFRHAAVTVGSFDGVHRGHRILLNNVIEAAAVHGGESVVLTLEPHPRIFFGDGNMRLLTTPDEKISLLEQAGIDNLVVMPFDLSFSRLTAREFIAEYLVGRTHAEHLTVGYNHRFGHDRQGGAEFLSAISREYGLQVAEVGCFDAEGDKVSSTVIRQAVGEGRMQTAARLTGHPYIIIGDVCDGVVTGIPEYKLLPPDGEYAAHAGGKECRLRIDGGKMFIDNDINGLITITL